MLKTTLNKIAKYDLSSADSKLWLDIMKVRGLPAYTLEAFITDDNPHANNNPFPGDDAPFPVSEIAKAGIYRLCWTARLFNDSNGLRVYQQFAINCASRVLHLVKEDRPLKAFSVAQLFLKGEVSENYMRKTILKYFGHEGLDLSEECFEESAANFQATDAVVSAVLSLAATNPSDVAQEVISTVCDVANQIASLYADSDFSLKVVEKAKHDMLCELVEMLDAYEPKTVK